MDITYLGHSCFKLKGSSASVVMDPFQSKSVGLTMPRLSADVVTCSHDHDDHNNAGAVSGTARRNKPFIIDAPGEYEVSGVGVFGFETFHDDKKGEERGKNTVFSVLIDGVSVVHLGDLGHQLSESKVAELNGVDVLLCPVGGHYTIGPKDVSAIVNALEPAFLVPMHYRSKEHKADVFGQVATLEDFLGEYGVEAKKEAKLSVSRSSMPEETEVVILEY